MNDSKKYETMKKLLIGGRALMALGSSRGTNDTDYLIFDESSYKPFICDEAANIDYINANGSNFFEEVWNMEDGNDTDIASPQALLELKAYALIQHLQNFKFQKADDCEYDIKFLVRNFNLEGVNIVNKYISAAELAEINKVINSTNI